MNRSLRRVQYGFSSNRGMTPRRQGNGQRGFTLVELVAVVTIIAVLATLAVYSLRKYIQYAKTAEAGEIIGSIRAGEEAYFDETYRYLSADSNDSKDAYYPDSPSDADGSIKIQWGADEDGCSDCAERYRALGVTPNAAVLFRYVTAAGVSGENFSDNMPTSNMTGSPFSSASTPKKPYYVVTAQSDLDGNGKPYTTYVGSSLQADVYSENVGQ